MNLPPPIYVHRVITFNAQRTTQLLPYAADICKITKEKHQSLLSKYQLCNLSLQNKIGKTNLVVAAIKGQRATSFPWSQKALNSGY